MNNLIKHPKAPRLMRRSHASNGQRASKGADFDRVVRTGHTVDPEGFQNCVHAAARYSWMSPPRRSWRSIVLADGWLRLSLPAGERGASARCDRSSLSGSRSSGCSGFGFSRSETLRRSSSSRLDYSTTSRSDSSREASSAQLADAVMATAFGSTLTSDERFATLELKIDFLRPIEVGRLIAGARVAHRSRRAGVIECTVTDADGRAVARATCTCLL
jgi:uncharacterized protein (TIGR00369 family)